MNKTRIAICMKDLEYQTRFVNCFMNHYNHQYELHVFTNKEQLLETNSKEYTAIITGEYSTDEMAEFVERGEILVYLREDLEATTPFLQSEVEYVQKYQEVYRIAEALERVLADRVSGYKTENSTGEYTCIGLFSLTQEQYQTPFAALLAKILGEQQKVLVMDLQPYSSMCTMEEGMTFMGLEDLLSVVTTGNYSKSRILECIRHEAEWDYVCAVQNMECLAEGTKELYESLMDIFVKELGYQTIIMNFGSIFVGQMEMMKKCKLVYLLCEKEQSQNWREEFLFQQLFRQEDQKLMKSIKKIAIPSSANQEKTWKALVDKWNWGTLGELLRQDREKEIYHGAAM